MSGTLLGSLSMKGNPMPARLTRRRIDRHPLYLTLLAALLVDAVIVITHITLHGSAHQRLSTGTGDLMAAIMGIGSVICLLSAASGSARFRPHADLRDGLMIQYWILLPVVLAMGVFAVGILATPPTVENIETVVLIAGNMAGLTWTAWNFRTQAIRLSQELRREVHSGR